MRDLEPRFVPGIFILTKSDLEFTQISFQGPVRSVIRAVPIAVLRPMIGASEAVSKTLMGLHNTMDPNVRLENEDKYKQR
jgi:hypothetical protein